MGTLYFYAVVGGSEYFLFTQDFRKTLKDYFSNGVNVDKTGNYSSAHSVVVRRVLDKLPSYLRYVEKEFGVDIYEKTKEQKTPRKVKAYKRQSFRWQDYAFAV